MKYQQPWLTNPKQEGLLIAAPLFIPVALVFAFKDYFLHSEVNTFWWVVLVLFIDVAHVYSTLFRFYWDDQTRTKYRNYLFIIPSAAIIIGISVHYYSAFLFWRILAYMAVYHFIRQQYGFMRLYSRKENRNKLFRLIDSLSIYNATLYPILYWHLHLTHQLSWFVPGDFIPLPLRQLDDILLVAFAMILVAYIVKETIVSVNNKIINIPKNLIIIGTYASWYVGIVLFQGDLIFTLLNVASHGIPYMALIWIYGEKKASSKFSFNANMLTFFILVLLVLAYIEEAIWDVFVWKDHTDVFPLLTNFPQVTNPLVLSILVPILVLPQIAHYILDGFIWRFSKDENARI